MSEQLNTILNHIEAAFMSLPISAWSAPAVVGDNDLPLLAYFLERGDIFERDGGALQSDVRRAELRCVVHVSENTSVLTVSSLNTYADLVEQALLDETTLDGSTLDRVYVQHEHELTYESGQVYGKNTILFDILYER